MPRRHAPVLVWSPERGRADWLLLPPVEYQLGDYSPGRYVHRLRDVRRLEHPLAVRGAQGLFTVPPELASRAAQASVVPVPYLTT